MGNRMKETGEELAGDKVEELDGVKGEKVIINISKGSKMIGVSLARGITKMEIIRIKMQLSIAAINSIEYLKG